MAGFQCELCHFRNCYKRNPEPSCHQDCWVMHCMRRANLDAFWACRPSTVQGNLSELKRVMQLAGGAGITSPFATYPRGPYPLADTMGMIPAIISLQRSLEPGKNSKTIQWHTMRNTCSCYSNVVHTTPMGTGMATMTNGKRSTHYTSSATNSHWFKRFMDRSHERMGDVKVQDQALTIDILLALQDVLEDSWNSAQASKDEEAVFEITTIGTALVCGFSSGLKGEELGHSRLHESMVLTECGMAHPRKPHIVLGLEGRFKGRIARRKHKIPLTPVSHSGIQNQRWLVRLISFFLNKRISSGPLLRASITTDEPAQIKDLDALFHKYLVLVRDIKPNLIPEDLDIPSRYSVKRSLRRGSTSQARSKKVPRDVINLNNRWRTEDGNFSNFYEHPETAALLYHMNSGYEQF